MRMYPLCPSCLLNRVYYEARLVTDDDEIIRRCVDEALKMLAENFSKRPINAHLATRIHRRVYEILNCEDPYKKVKEKANEVAKRFLPEAEKIVEKSEDKFKTSLIASIIGNTFDYGVLGHKVSEEIRDYFMSMIKKGLKIDHTDRIKELCKGNVVYLTDNAGEIFFDTLFMREIKKTCKRLTVVVRGRPVLSDATLEDALLAGVDKIADEILTNGKGAIGIILEELPDETLKRLESADIIIAKGMANYECLSEAEFKPIAFLLTAKCEPVAKDIGVEVEDMVAMVVE